MAPLSLRQMHSAPARAMALLAAAMLLLSGPLAAQRQQVGIVASFAGDVTMRAAGQTTDRKLVRKQRVGWGDVIRTQKRSQAQLLLLDRSSFSIGANTRMVIDRMVYDPREGRSLVGRVFEGTFRFLSGRRNANSRATIESPVGTIGIRGTALDGVIGENAVEIAKDEDFIRGNVRHDKETATLVILRGPGAGTQGGLFPGLADVTAAGTTVTLDAPGLAAYIPRAGAAPIGPFRISNKGLSRVQDLLSPAVTRANDGGGGLGTLAKIVGAAAVAVGVGLLLTGDDDDNPPGVNTNPNGTTATPGVPQTQTGPTPRPTPTPTPTPNPNGGPR